MPRPSRVGFWCPDVEGVFMRDKMLDSVPERLDAQERRRREEMARLRELPRSERALVLERQERREAARKRALWRRHLERLAEKEREAAEKEDGQKAPVPQELPESCHMMFDERAAARSWDRAYERAKRVMNGGV